MRTILCLLFGRGGWGVVLFFPSLFIGGGISFVIDAATCRDVFLSFVNIH